MALDDLLMSFAGVPTSSVSSATNTPPTPPTPTAPANAPSPTDASTPPASAQPAADSPSAPPAMAAAKDPDKPTFMSTVSGPFGTKGILGGILGTIEDAVLVNAGLKPVYQPKVVAARQADAISGWDTDPAGAYLRLASVAGVPAADAHLTSLVDGSYKNQQIAQSQQQIAASQQQMGINAQKAPVDLQVEQAKLQAPYMSQAAHITDDASAQKFGPIVRAAFARNHWDASELPTTDDAKSWQAWSLKGVPPGTLYSTDKLDAYRQVREGQIQQGLDQQGDNIQSEIGYRGTMAGVAQANAGTNQGRLAETTRHDQVTEGQGQQRIGQGAQRIQQGAQRVQQGQQRIDLKAAANRPPPPSFEGQTATNHKTGQSFKAVKVNGQLTWQ